MSDGLPVLDFSVLSKSLGGDKDLIQEILAIFRETTPEIIQSLLNNLGEGDLEAVRNNALYLKGSSGNIGAIALHESMKSIENACNAGDPAETAERVNEAVIEYNRLISILDS